MILTRLHSLQSILLQVPQYKPLKKHIGIFREPKATILMVREINIHKLIRSNLMQDRFFTKKNSFVLYFDLLDS